jgi:hypothetical protein
LDDGVASTDTYDPGLHTVSILQLVWSDRSWYCPSVTLHAPHLRSDVGVHDTIWYCPAEQIGDTGWHGAWPIVGLYVWNGHGWHSRSDVGVAGSACVIPAAHCVVLPHVVFWPGSGLNVPAGHVVHTRSLVSVTLACCCWPAGHVVAMLQLTWPGMFWYSPALSSHCVHCSEFSASEYEPAGHGAHSHELIGVAARTTTCPNAHGTAFLQESWPGRS